MLTEYQNILFVSKNYIYYERSVVIMTANKVTTVRLVVLCLIGFALALSSPITATILGVGGLILFLVTIFRLDARLVFRLNNYKSKDTNSLFSSKLGRLNDFSIISKDDNIELYSILTDKLNLNDTKCLIKVDNLINTPKVLEENNGVSYTNLWLCNNIWLKDDEAKLDKLLNSDKLNKISNTDLKINSDYNLLYRIIAFDSQYYAVVDKAYTSKFGTDFKVVD